MDLKINLISICSTINIFLNSSYTIRKNIFMSKKHTNRWELAKLQMDKIIPAYNDLSKRCVSYIKNLEEFTRSCQAIRSTGSAALDLAYVASGKFDGFWHPSLKHWDIAAGVVIVREAGGFVGDFRGGESFFESGDIVAANPKYFKAIVQKLSE